MNDLLQKLKESETSINNAFKEFKKVLPHDYQERPFGILRSALQAVQRAQQIVGETQGNSKVDRQEFTQQGDTECHESYGVISITKPTGHMRLAGAMVDNLPSCIEIRIHRGKRVIDRHLNTEHWFSDMKKPLVTIRLSTYQWAEALSSLNGVGVTCTVKDVLGVPMNEPPKEARTPLEQIAEDAKAESKMAEKLSGEDFLGALNDLSSKIDGLKLSGKKTEELKKTIKEIGQRFHTRPIETAAWVSRRLGEESEKFVAQAKIEIAAAFNSTIQAAGLGALHEKMGLKAENLVPQLKGKSQ